jgi:hypothetical protein
LARDEPCSAFKDFQEEHNLGRADQPERDRENAGVFGQVLPDAGELDALFARSGPGQPVEAEKAGIRIYRPELRRIG